MSPSMGHSVCYSVSNFVSSFQVFWSTSYSGGSRIGFCKSFSLLFIRLISCLICWLFSNLVGVLVSLSLWQLVSQIVDQLIRHIGSLVGEFRRFINCSVSNLNSGSVCNGSVVQWFSDLVSWSLGELVYWSINQWIILLICSNNYLVCSSVS